MGPTENQTESPKRRKPGRSVNKRENELIRLAVDLAEKQLREGNASAQVITHYLKLGSSRESLEKKKIEMENDLLVAKAAQIKSMGSVEGLYAKAIDAMRSYSGRELADDSED